MASADPAKRPSQPRTPIPTDLLESRAGSDVRLGPTSVAAALRDAKRGGAAGLSGMRAEHFKLLLQDVPRFSEGMGCDTFDNAMRPYQFALQARAGTDALTAHVRAALELQPDGVLVSLDGL